jgi:hypothetical protein
MATKKIGDEIMSTDKGVKFDTDKEDCDLVLGEFSRALMAVSQVGTFGARKYTPSGWLEVPNAYKRYSSAMWRHYLQSKVALRDSDSTLIHDAHTAWNALARLELRLRGIVEVENLPDYDDSNNDVKYK